MKSQLVSKTLIATGLTIGVLSIHAEELTVPGTFSANIALTTDYTFRGISQADEDPAIQGGMDYAVDVAQTTAFYFGFWGSNVEQEDINGNLASLELDIYGGFTGEFIAGIEWDLGAIHYIYPGARLDFTEVYTGLNYAFGVPFNPTLSAMLSYSPDFFAKTGDAFYIKGALDLEFPHQFFLRLAAGHQTIADNATFGTSNYTDWRVSISRDVLGFNLDGSYVDTDLSKSECFDGTRLCNARGVFTISRSF